MADLSWDLFILETRIRLLGEGTRKVVGYGRGCADKLGMVWGSEFQVCLCLYAKNESEPKGRMGVSLLRSAQ